jgi:2',3'-cyclic-nucleotide 2'-phosphodiesterase (5'-nucleotidase family)
MLTAATESGDDLPLILEAGIDWERTLSDSSRAENAALLKAALDSYGCRDYAFIEKGGVKIAVFGIYGKEADSFAPESGLYFFDPIECAKKTVAAIQADGGADLIVCVSHSGTSVKAEESEDELLAKAVPEINLIISGHTHTKLDKPIIHGNTIIASSGEYTYSLGHLTLQKSGGSYTLKDYSLIPLDGTVADDAGMLGEIAKYKALVNEKYMSQFGYEYDEVLAKSDFAFTPAEDFGDKQGEDTLGSLISDSYIYAVKQAEGGAYKTIDAAVVPAGVVRGSFGEGEITAADVFNVSSLGIGKDGVPGYPLVSLYLTGTELRTMAEVDISVSELMSAARLYISGLTYTYNPNRLFLNRVTEVKLVTADGTAEIDDDALYRVVGGLYSCQMLGAVESKSYGLLSIVPKDENGDPITDYEQRIVYEDGHELKEWTALAEYIKSFDKENGVAKIPPYYAEKQGRKTESDKISINELFKNPNKIFFLALAAALVVILIMTLIIVFIIKLVRRKRRQKS